MTLFSQAFSEGRTRSKIADIKPGFQASEEHATREKYHGDKAYWALDAWIKIWWDPAFENWSLISALEQVAWSSLVIYGEKDEYGSHRVNQVSQFIEGLALQHSRSLLS